jgi:guanylate kinase
MNHSGYIHVCLPSLEVLERRLSGRLIEHQSIIDQRIAFAASEMETSDANPDQYDNVLEYEKGKDDKLYYDLKVAINKNK